MKLMSLDVLIPVRSPAPWLSLAVESVYAQSRKPNNVIVVVHGQIDQEMCDVLGRHEIRVLNAPESYSFDEVLNIGLRDSDADFIARIDSDDIWSDTHLARLLRVFEENPDTVLVSGRATYINEIGVMLGLGVRTSTKHLNLQLLFRNPFVHSAVVFRRDPAVEVGGYSRCVAAEDLLLWLELARVGRLAISEKTTIKYRLHIGQTSGSPMSADDKNLFSKPEFDSLKRRGYRK